jgi:hypothetical protein
MPRSARVLGFSKLLMIRDKDVELLGRKAKSIVAGAFLATVAPS